LSFHLITNSKDSNAPSAGKGVAAMDKTRVKQETGRHEIPTVPCIQGADTLDRR